ncbi:MAG: type II toxin-antitoxin system PemK/MazF family toxin [Anaerolineae bacterium]
MFPPTSLFRGLMRSDSRMTVMSLSLPQILVEQADRLAQSANISRDEIVRRALEQYLEDAALSRHKPRAEQVHRKSTVRQGDIYWVRFQHPDGLVSEIRHPQVVVQDNVLNDSRLTTTIICAITSNMRRASLPGHIRLEAGEGNLARPSVIEVSKVSSVDTSALEGYIGSLSESRIREVLDGMRFLHRSTL